MYVVPVIKQICFKDIKLLALKYVKSELKHDPLCTGTFKEGYSDWLSQKFTDGVNAGEKKMPILLIFFVFMHLIAKTPQLMLWGRCTGSIRGKDCILKTTLAKTHQSLQRVKAYTSVNCVCTDQSFQKRKYISFQYLLSQ